MMITPTIRTWVVGWLAAAGIVAMVGCRPTLEQSSTAEALPAVQVTPTKESMPAGNWPGWRGAEMGGVARDESLPLHWSETEGVRWKVKVPGHGNSSPVVWGDRVWLTSEVGSSPAKLAVLCYDRNDGSLRWRADAATVENNPTHVKNGHASASVATDAERVYAFFGSEGLFCFNLGGRQLWHADLGRLDHVWGTASSPVVYRDQVFQLGDHENNSFLVALDCKTGAERWRTARDSYGTWSTPVVVEAETPEGPRSELIVNGTGTDDPDGGWVIAYDPRSGAELWRVQGTTDIVTPTLMVHAGLVFSTSGRNGPTMAIRPGGSGDVSQDRMVWKLRRGGAYVPTGVGYGNRLFMISDGGVAACYNAGNGEMIWRKRLKGVFTASLIAGAGRIYATNERGTVYVLAADDTFRLLATNEMGARCLATPAPSHGELLIRTEGHLYCIAAEAASALVADADDPAIKTLPADGGSVRPVSSASSAGGAGNRESQNVKPAKFSLDVKRPAPAAARPAKNASQDAAPHDSTSARPSAP